MKRTRWSHLTFWFEIWPWHIYHEYFIMSFATRCQVDVDWSYFVRCQVRCPKMWRGCVWNRRILWSGTFQNKGACHHSYMRMGKEPRSQLLVADWDRATLIRNSFQNCDKTENHSFHCLVFILRRQTDLFFSKYCLIKTSKGFLIKYCRFILPSNDNNMRLNVWCLKDMINGSCWTFPWISEWKNIL